VMVFILVIVLCLYGIIPSPIAWFCYFPYWQIQNFPLW
jgi:hypothetical protein